MSDEDKKNRAVEIAISERVMNRLWTQLLALFGVSLAVGAAIGFSVVWEYRAISDLSRARISEYQMLVADRLEELHALDLEEVARRTRPARPCESPLPREDARAFLASAQERTPTGQEIDELLAKAGEFGICDIGQVQHLFDNPAHMARIETVYRILLQRDPDPIGRFIYGYWLESGVGVEAVARDIMVSPEFQRLKSLSAP